MTGGILTLACPVSSGKIGDKLNVLANSYARVENSGEYMCCRPLHPRQQTARARSAVAPCSPSRAHSAYGSMRLVPLIVNYNFIILLAATA